MKIKEGEMSVLQIPAENVLEDGDRNLLFPLPLTAYVQRLDGEPLDGKRYIKIKIDCKGKIKRELT